jgi:hypothetical protein
MLGAEVRQVNERADEPKTASYHSSENFSSCSPSVPMLYGRSTTWHGLAGSTRIKATRSVLKATRWPQGLLCGARIWAPAAI